MINITFYNKRSKFGPFVYRLGHVVFILERGVRFPRDRHIFMPYYVYMLKNIDRIKPKTYVGYTTDIKRRLLQHNTNKGAKSTKGYKWILIYKKEIY